MSRLLLTICAIFFVHRQHTVTSYTPKNDLEAALRLKEYMATVEKISISDSTRMIDDHDQDMKKLDEEMTHIQEIIEDINNTMNIHGITEEQLQTLAFKSPPARRIIRQCNNIQFSPIIQDIIKMILELNSCLMSAYAAFVKHCVSYYHHEYHKSVNNRRRMSMTFSRKQQNSYSDIRKCRQVISEYLQESTEPLRGEETIELEGNFQRFIALEPDMDYAGSCYFEECHVPPSGQLQSEYLLDGYYRTKPCRGHVTTCEPVRKIEICYANDSSVSRYEGFKFDNQIYGNMNSCPGGKYSISSWRRWFVMCDVCLCTCITTSRDITRTQVISYAEQTSDIENNMVVTNVRFVEKNKAIYIQIEEKSLSLLKFGNDTSRINWKRISVKNEELRQVRDMQRCMDLKTAYVPIGYVVTGVKFGPYTPEGGLLIGAHHQFQIHVRATPYDESQNKLMTSDSEGYTSYWVDPDFESPSTRDFFKVRSSVPSFNVGDLYESPAFDKITDSVEDQYMCFRTSNLQDDGGQSTIPFFDARPAIPYRPRPLIGVGVSLKGYGGSKGYLTLELLHY